MDPATFIQEWGLPISTLLIVILTAFLTRRMDASELGLQLHMRLIGHSYQQDEWEMKVQSLAVYEQPKRTTQFFNLFRRYPKGAVKFTIDLRGPGISPEEPWDGMDFAEYCSRHGFADVKVRKRGPPKRNWWNGDAQVSLLVPETHPDKVTNFIEGIVGEMAGDEGFTITWLAGDQEND